MQYTNFKDIPRNKYNIIYADPPWAFKVYSDKGKDRSAEKHYKTMTLQDICDLPVADIAAKDAVLFMWVTMPILDKSFKVIESWGFKYKTCGFSWMKQNRKSPGLFIGNGYWTRGNSEIALLATRGKPKRVDAGVPQAVLEPRREHSRKPDCVRDRIVRLMGDLPRIELFARQAAFGWDSYGNQIERFKEAVNG